MSASFRTIPLLQPVVFAVLLHVLWAASQDAKVRAPNINWTSAAALPQCTADWSTIVVDTAAAPILTSPCNISRLFPDVYPDGTKPRYDPADDSTLWYKIEKGSVPNGQRMVLWFDMKRNTGSFGILVMSDPTEGCKQMYVGGFFRGCWHCDYSNRIWTDHVAFMVNSSVTYYIAISSTPPSSNLKISCKAPYPNTDFRKAKTLTCNGSTHGSTVGATGIGDDPPCLVSVIDETRHTGETRLLVQRRGLVWFKLPPEQPPSKVHLTLKSRRHTTSMMVFVAGSKRRWDECATVVVQQYEQLTEVNFSTDGNSTYYVAVFEEDRGVRNEGLVWENEGGFDLHTTCSVTQHPVNDDWTNATSIKCNSSIAIDTNGATRDETYPCAFKGPRPKDGNFVWFKIQPSQVARKKVVQIDVHGKEEQLLIFGRRESEQVDDECTLYMSSLRGEDFTGKIEFAIDGVSTYYVAGAFSQFDVTGVALKIKCLDGVPNDSFEDAQPITCGSVVSGDLRGATWEWSPFGYSTTPLNNFPCVRSPSVSANTYGDLPYVWYIWDSSKAPSGSRVSAEVTGVLSSENIGMESVVLVQAEMGQWGGACQYDAPLPIYSDGKSSYFIGVRSDWLPNSDDITAYTLKLICEDAPTNIDYHKAIPVQCNKEISGTTAGSAGAEHKLPCDTNGDFDTRPNDHGVWFILQRDSTPTVFEVNITVKGGPQRPSVKVLGVTDENGGEDKCWTMSQGGDFCIPEVTENIALFKHDPRIAEFIYVYECDSRVDGGPFTLQVTCGEKVQPAPNDHYKSASPIDCSTNKTVDLRKATFDKDLPCEVDASLLPSSLLPSYRYKFLWYKFPDGQPTRQKVVRMQFGEWQTVNAIVLGRRADKSSSSKCTFVKFERGPEISFRSDGVSTYFIGVSPYYEDNLAAMAMKSTCLDATVNDNFEDALPITCNTTLEGTLKGVSEDIFRSTFGDHSGYSLTATNNMPCTMTYYKSNLYIWYKFDGATTPVDLVITASQTGLPNAQVIVLVPKDPKQVNGECLYETSSPFASDGSSIYYIGMGFDWSNNYENFSVTLTC